MDRPDVSIVVVNWNTRPLLLDCLGSVFATVEGLRYEVWVVDNGSSDGSADAVRIAFPTVHLLENARNFGFAAANNRALRRMRGRYALLLNSDTVLVEGAVEELFRYLEDHPGAGMACGQLLNADGSAQNSVAGLPGLLSLTTNESLLRVLFPRRFPDKRRRPGNPTEVDSCIGACLMVRKEAMDAVGLLDERFFFFLEETDWAVRMRRGGWRVCFVPHVSVYHLQGQSVGHHFHSRMLFHRSRDQYFRKWYPRAYPLLTSAAFVRILINAALNLMGVFFTLGRVRGLREKTTLNLRLAAWYLRGRPLEE
jgi:GT2 family glycosyltransferase